MRDLPDFVLPEEGNEPSPPAPSPNDSAWKGFFLVFGIHILCNLIAIMIAPKTAFLFPLFYLPFVQWLYVAPIMIVLSKQEKKRMVKGALLAALITAAPLALIMLLAFAGLALCAVIMAGAGSLSHH